MDIRKTLTTVETGFNIAGSIPIIGVASGLIRVAAAKLQVIAGLFAMAVGLLGQAMSSDRKWEEWTHLGGENCIHGCLNVLRGIGEVLLGATFIGSCGLFAGQYLSQNKFAPIVTYDAPSSAVGARAAAAAHA